MKRKRVAGIMRVKNEGTFIHDCVESCIDALDELIVVYNDCTDKSEEEIKKMADKYPSKIRYYAYPYEIRAFNLSQKEFEEIKNYPEDNPHLFSAYSNFALSKVTADYALKIDADQVYFTNKLKEWCDFMRDCEPIDTIMFKMSDKVRFRKFVMNEYNTNISDNFIVAEDFVHPYKSLTYIGYFWKHVRTMRPGVREAALKAYSIDKEAFLDIDSFKKLSYRRILRHSPKTIFFPFYRILFEFIYKSNKHDLFDSLANESFGQLKK